MPEESVLLHFDLQDTNVLVEGGELTGLIDFGDLSCGPRAYDLAKLYAETEGGEEFSHFLSGYGEADPAAVRYFALLHLLYQIPYFHAAGKAEEKMRRAAFLRRLVEEESSVR